MLPRDRLSPDTFNIPVTEIRRGYRSAVYFSRAKQILEAHKPNTPVTMQIFQKQHGVACGIDEMLAILRFGAGRWQNMDKVELLFDKLMTLKPATSYMHDPKTRLAAWETIIEVEEELDSLWIPAWDELEVYALHDGDEIEPWEPVVIIQGNLPDFVHLESVNIGVMARRTKVASNMRKVVDAASQKPVLCFADRFDHYATQGGDGYAAHIGGAAGIATDAQGRWWHESGMGTMPHALIAAFDGDVVDACRAYIDTIPNSNLIALVDFNNDCVGDAARCLEEFGEDLWGVRLDTSENMIDATIATVMANLDDETRNLDFEVGDFKPTGVNAALVHLVREELDSLGGEHVKIIVSGGFNTDKIEAFESGGVPVDAYAVGSSLLQGNYDYTADVVEPYAKLGRFLRETDRLSVVSP